METVVRTLSSAQAIRGHRVIVLSVVVPSPREHPFVDSMKGGNVEVAKLEIHPRAYFKERRIIRGILRELSPDILHTHGYRPDVLDAPVARRLGIPTVTTVHGFTGNGLRNRLYERLQRYAFRQFDGVVVVSRKLRREILQAGIPASRLHLIQNAWIPERPPISRMEARRTLGLDERSRVIGFVGRFTPEKGADVLIRAFSSLSEPGTVLSLIGTGPQEGMLRELAGSLGVGDRIRWHGIIPNAGQLMGAFDLFVLPSRTEGTPMVLFEAMAAEVPVVCTSVGGVPDVVSDAEAVLVTSENSEEMGKAIRTTLSSEQESSVRAERARRRLRHEFSVDPWVERYDGVYAASMD